MRTLVLGALVLAGCATTNSAYVPTVALTPEKRVETRPLPPDPATEALPPGTPPGDWAQAQEVGECFDKNGKALPGAPSPCPAKAGLLLSEAKVARDVMYRIRYPELRKSYEADRAVWAAQRELYETRLNDAQKALHDAEPNWFQRNAGQLGVVGGFVLGAGMAVAIVFAVNQVSHTAPQP